MTPFAFATAGRIAFGSGVARQALEIAPTLGQRAFVVTGGNPDRAAWLTAGLAQAGMTVAVHPCPGEPTVDDATLAVTAARGFAADLVIAIGGGAALDLGKAVAGLLHEPGPVLDHLEVVGRGLPLAAPPLPFVAVPTTAGTGAEVTKNAVIGLPGHGRKVSLRDDRMIPRVAIVDPALTDGCPKAVTLASGLDAVTQVIEPWLSCKATPYTDAIARPTIAPGLAALVRLMEGEDPDARDALAWTSLCGGLALANSGLGAVHGLAGVIGGLTGAAHGSICGALLGPVLAMNLRLAPGLRVREVCGLIAGVLGGAQDEAPARLAGWALAQGLPGLAAQGLRAGDHREVAEAALQASSMKGNPVQPSVAELIAVLEAA
jgi:alcohol dehydrogenase class IV